MESPQKTPGGELARVVARLDALIDWERRQRASMRVSTEPARRLLAELGDPHASLRVVHVTGSKGKGSTAALIAAGLVRAGLRVGRYASPHVERINERVVIDGREVEDALLAQALGRALAARETVRAADARVDPTWFDVVTAAALWVFAAERVEWLVAEVGLGGRLDSTNVLTGEVCVITNVELEHTAVLGSTRAAIAAEKAGILKRGCALVTSLVEDDEAGVVVAATARELDVEVLRPEWAGGLAPSVTEANRSLAALALDVLGRRGVLDRDGKKLSGELLDPATVAAARLPGRAERFFVRGVPVVLDGAHTPGSVAALLRDCVGSPALPGLPLVVLGMARDKDLEGILKVLAPATEKVFCTSVGSELHRTPDELASAARAFGVAVESAEPPSVALDRALSAACGRWVLVVGSLYLAGNLRPALRQATS